MYRDVVDAAGFAVWERVQAGEPLTGQLCQRVVAELGSTANAERVYYQARKWRSEIAKPAGWAGGDSPWRCVARW
jgi:hypothetical protein